MSSHRALRFGMILGGMLVSIGAVCWPVLRQAKQAAGRAGIT
jgi:hypothetical protein